MGGGIVVSSSKPHNTTEWLTITNEGYSDIGDRHRESPRQHTTFVASMELGIMGGLSSVEGVLLGEFVWRLCGKRRRKKQVDAGGWEV